MFCTRCGQQNPADAHFCARCGAPLMRPGAPVPERGVDQTSTLNLGSVIEEVEEAPDTDVGAVEALPPGSALLPVSAGSDGLPRSAVLQPAHRFVRRCGLKHRTTVTVDLPLRWAIPGSCESPLGSDRAGDAHSCPGARQFPARFGEFSRPLLPTSRQFQILRAWSGAASGSARRGSRAATIIPAARRSHPALLKASPNFGNVSVVRAQ